MAVMPAYLVLRSSKKASREGDESSTISARGPIIFLASSLVQMRPSWGLAETRRQRGVEEMVSPSNTYRR